MRLRQARLPRFEETVLMVSDWQGTTVSSRSLRDLQFAIEPAQLVSSPRAESLWSTNGQRHPYNRPECMRPMILSVNHVHVYLQLLFDMFLPSGFENVVTSRHALQCHFSSFLHSECGLRLIHHVHARSLSSWRSHKL